MWALSEALLLAALSVLPYVSNQACCAGIHDLLYVLMFTGCIAVIMSLHAGGHGTSRASADESINWNAAEACLLEVTSGTRGVRLTCLSIAEDLDLHNCTTGNSQVSAHQDHGRAAGGVSRLSKLGLFKCYKELQQQETTKISASTAVGITYAAAKSANTRYSAAKQQLYCHFEQMMDQSWMRRSELLPQHEDWLASG